MRVCVFHLGFLSNVYVFCSLDPLKSTVDVLAKWSVPIVIHENVPNPSLQLDKVLLIPQSALYLMMNVNCDAA